MTLNEKRGLLKIAMVLTDQMTNYAKTEQGDTSHPMYRAAYETMEAIIKLLNSTR